ncbi:MAG TPA: cyclodeaminase/cyclohydrolase family protein [Acetomicrobium sp.]|jgi:formiminotetrahydrofolate cyclodeaminase|nr:cyclodeaminase/cyclohydrolase family protein [Acetomicrobium sp.]
MSMMEMTIEQFLRELASDSPAPGGGSVAALGGALGAALVSMVARLTMGKEKYKEEWVLMEELAEKADKLRDEFLALMDEDVLAFNEFMQAMRLPKDTDEDKAKRSVAMQEALKKAALVPMETLRACLELSKQAVLVVEKGNVNAITDSGTALLLSSSAAKAAAYNVRINLGGIKDQKFCDDLRADLKDLLKEIEGRVIEGLEKVERNL